MSTWALKSHILCTNSGSNRTGCLALAQVLGLQISIFPLQTQCHNSFFIKLFQYLKTAFISGLANPRTNRKKILNSFRTKKMYQKKTLKLNQASCDIYVSLERKCDSMQVARIFLNKNDDAVRKCKWFQFTNQVKKH